MAKIRWLSVIRCVGILFILIYHFFKDFLPGGFIGVDMFLTLSGFLITMQIVEKSRTGRGHEFADFVKRRFKRIFPTLFIMVIICLPLALLISPDFTASISKQTAAALSFVTNYYEIQSGGSYEAQMLPHLFVHTWFLAVEMHIYIFWGLVLAIIVRSTKKRGVDARQLVFVLSVIFAALSFIHMQALYNAYPTDPSAAYFGSTSRAFPFFIGAIAGTLAGESTKDSRKAHFRSSLRRLTMCAVIIAIVGLAVIAFSVDYNGAAAYRWGMLSASLLTAVLIRLLMFAHAYTPGRVKEPAILVIMSDMSYGVYLFHWPLYIVFSNLPFMPGNAAAAGVAFIVSLCLSAFVSYWVQPALKNRRVKRVRRKKLSARAVIVTMMIFLIILSGFTLNRAPNISTLEQNMYIAYLQQDSDMLYDYEFTVKSANVGSGNLTQPDGINVATEVNVAATPRPMQASDASPSGSLQQTVPVQSPPSASAGVADPSPPAQAGVAEPSPPTSQGVAEPPPSASEGVIEPPPSASTEGTQSPPSTPAGGAELPPDVSEEPVESPQVSDSPDTAGFFENTVVIGDSVLLGARKALMDAVPGSVVNADGSRQMWQGYEHIMQLQSEGTLQEYVVISLGTNGNENSFDYIDRLIADLEPGHRLIFVTPYNGQGGERSVTYRTAVYIRSLPEKYDFVTIADWSAAIMPNPHAIGTDKIHIGGNPAGINLYVNCVVDALYVAATRPVKQ